MQMSPFRTDFKETTEDFDVARIHLQPSDIIILSPLLPPRIKKNSQNHSLVSKLRKHSRTTLATTIPAFLPSPTNNGPGGRVGFLRKRDLWKQEGEEQFQRWYFLEGKIAVNGWERGLGLGFSRGCKEGC